jgi:hypothetical protein
VIDFSTTITILDQGFSIIATLLLFQLVSFFCRTHDIISVEKLFRINLTLKKYSFRIVQVIIELPALRARL